jgi:hypothetical protein
MPSERKAYDSMIADRPAKFDEDEVEYRMAEKKGPRCGTCVHFFERKVDGFTTCEIFRPADDGPVKENYVCDYWTEDGETFPLLK